MDDNKRLEFLESKVASIDRKIGILLSYFSKDENYIEFIRYGNSKFIKSTESKFVKKSGSMPD